MPERESILFPPRFSIKWYLLCIVLFLFPFPPTLIHSPVGAVRPPEAHTGFSEDPGMKKVLLREVAHTRAGEKIDLLNVGVIAYREEDYPLLRDQLTLEKVLSLYAPISKGSSVRYELPNIGALNFVFDGILEGGRTRTLSFEESGKALASLLLILEIEVPDNYVTRSEEVAGAK